MEPMLGKVLVVLRFQFYAFYLLLQTIYQKLTEVSRLICGTADIPRGKTRVCSILWRYKVDPEEITKRKDFILTSGHFETVDILNNSHWSIYTIEKDFVLFVLLPEPIYSYNIEQYPFIYVPMYEKALAVAEVKRAEFLEFAEKLGKNAQPKTVLYTNTARCGSTLFGKMLHRPGVSVCYGEPPALTNLSIALGEQLMSESEVRTLLHATITCLRAHLPENVLCVLKTQSFEARLVSLCDGVSNLKHIFMFRKKCLLSIEKACRRSEFLYTIFLEMYKYSKYLSRCFSTLIAGEGKWVRELQPQDMRALAAIMLASPYSEHEKNKHMYCHPIVWHHEVINDTEKLLSSVFTELGIPLSCIPEAIQCKAEDSQKESFLSRKNLEHVKLAPVSEADRAMLRAYAKKMNIPDEVFETD